MSAAAPPALDRRLPVGGSSAPNPPASRRWALRIFATPLLVAALSLAGCSGGDEPASSALGEAAKAVGSLLGERLDADGVGNVRGPVAPGALPAGLSRAAIAQVEGPLLLANLDSLGVAATLRLARENGGYRTFASPDKVTLTTRGGIVTATRGLPADLLAADAAPLLAAFAGGPSNYARELRLLGGDRQILRGSLTCRLEPVGEETIEVLERQHRTRHHAEVCTDPAGGNLRNDYWLGADGTMWKSRQFLNAQLGYLTLQTLIE